MQIKRNFDAEHTYLVNNNNSVEHVMLSNAYEDKHSLLHKYTTELNSILYGNIRNNK